MLLPPKVTLTKLCLMLLLLRVQPTKQFWMPPPLKARPIKPFSTLLQLRTPPTLPCRRPVAQ
jgi:hypothetical protein